MQVHRFKKNACGGHEGWSWKREHARRVVFSNSHSSWVPRCEQTSAGCFSSLRRTFRVFQYPETRDVFLVSPTISSVICWLLTHVISVTGFRLFIAVGEKNKVSFCITLRLAALFYLRAGYWNFQTTGEGRNWKLNLPRKTLVLTSGNWNLVCCTAALRLCFARLGYCSVGGHCVDQILCALGTEYGAIRENRGLTTMWSVRMIACNHNALCCPSLRFRPAG